jgi:glucuronoarabinoxylan endo-1,4-beta-xylanase
VTFIRKGRALSRNRSHLPPFHGSAWVLAVLAGIAACGGGGGSASPATGASASGGQSGNAGGSGAAPTGDGGGAAGSGGAQPICGGGVSQAGDVVVDPADPRQTIAGFGASTAWGSTMTAADADLLWSTTAGAGLSLHRVRIDYQSGQTSETAIAKLAVARGVTVWATPWTPPAADKSGSGGANGEVGGTLSNPSAYAAFLAGFVSYMKGQGVPIYAVSAQNEPDAQVSYESCSYTGASLASFIGTYMAPALTPTGVKIIAPETQNWCTFPSYESALAANPGAWGATSIIATHEYGCSPQAYPAIAAAGKQFWATEIYDQGSTIADPGIASALRVAKLIHDALTIANMNAWHYWWVYPLAADNGALWDMASGKPTKRLWVEGNFARFVRPGFERVGTTGAPPSGVFVSAYYRQADGSVAIVAINDNAGSASLPLSISGAGPCSLTPWVTSATDNLAEQPPIALSAGRAAVTLGGQSVTTLVAGTR